MNWYVGLLRVTPQEEGDMFYSHDRKRVKDRCGRPVPLLGVRTQQTEELHVELKDLLVRGHYLCHFQTI
jgi:hypothetical protein